MNIAILNLHRDIDKDQLEKLFTAYGKVESCELVLDKKTGKSKGFGFVVMNDEIEVKIAIAELHGSRVSNQKIRVKISDK